MDAKNIIFALDIGTRSITGIVGYEKEDQVLHIAATETIEHESRAMLDGQIHDINKVAQVAGKVKQRLEEKIGFSLKQVSLAAAGRVLKTYDVFVEKEVLPSEEITQEGIQELELEGIYKAKVSLQEDLQDEEERMFFCVGYTVVNYFLNGMIIGNLEGHRGKKIGAKILSTFLPHTVVDSLYTAMKKINLEVKSLTLEPIAAIQAAIPENLRLLNLALVDIGAGTSDIAITKDGTVVAYDMVSIAGDEITEKIVHSYLVDFNRAEQIKISLKVQDQIEYVDILGIPHKVSSDQVFGMIIPTIEELATTIADKIIEANGGKTPNAVFCVGGGGQVIGFEEILATKLDLPKERVVIRGTDALQKVVFDCEALEGPQFITPIGIAKTSSSHAGYEFIKVTLNNKSYKVMNTTKTTIADLAVTAGYTPKDLLHTRGTHLTFTLNGKEFLLKGEYGVPATIRCNGKEVGIDHTLQQGDTVEIKVAQKGKDASAAVADYIQEGIAKNVFFEGNPFDVSPKVMINGQAASIDSEIHNHDEVFLIIIETIENFFDYIEVSISEENLFVNGSKVSKEHRLCEGDQIDIREPLEESRKQTLENFFQEVKEKDAKKRITVNVNGEVVSLEAEKEQFIFVDIFSFIDFDLSNPKGNIVLLLNGQKAGFTDDIQEGDRIEIYWSKA